jgi:hypothetical protein
MDSAGLSETLVEMEKRVSELKALYENYFAGIERREPLQKRDALTRQLRQLMVEGRAATQLQFRLSNLRARFTTLETYWNRVTKEIEEGRFHKRRPGLEKEAPKQAPAAAPIAPEAKPQEPVSDTAFRELYKSYSEARAKAGEAPITFDAMVSSLKRQVPQVIERYKCKSVDFKVSQKDGKTIIKAVPIA